MVVHNDTPQFFLQKTKWPPKNKMATKNKIVHNSGNFEARSSRFFKVVHNDPQQYFSPKNKMAAKKTKWPSKTKLSITQSISKLEAPDFAW